MIATVGARHKTSAFRAAPDRDQNSPKTSAIPTTLYPTMSSSSSASSSRSSSPEPIPKNAKGKGKAGNTKNEGSDVNWALEPPAGAVAIDNASVSAGEFDWDAVNADQDNEVWLIRIPEGVRASSATRGTMY